MSQTKESTSTPKGKILHELGAYDVLLGRGTGPNENQGNVRFREILKDTMGKYTLPGYAMSKAQIAREVLDQVKARNGNFVRKLGKGETGATANSTTSPPPAEPYNGGRTKNFLYVIVPDAVAMEKTKQSIRFQIKAARKQNKFDAAAAASPLGASSSAVKTTESLLEAKLSELAGRAPTSRLMSLSPAASSKIAGGAPASVADLIAWPNSLAGSQGASAASSAAGLLHLQESVATAAAVSSRIQDALAIKSHIAAKQQEALEREQRAQQHHQALEQYYATILLQKQQQQQAHQEAVAAAASFLGSSSSTGAGGIPQLPTATLLSSLSRRNVVPTSFDLETMLRGHQQSTDPSLLVLQAAKNNSLKNSLF